VFVASRFSGSAEIKKAIVGKGVTVEAEMTNTLGHFWSLCWDSKHLSQAAFNIFMQALNPTSAPRLLRRGTPWFKDVADDPIKDSLNIHFSRSPLEAVAHRMNWLGAQLVDDSFVDALITMGATSDVINQWIQNPRIRAREGESLMFEAVQGLDNATCVQKCREVLGYTRAAEAAKELVQQAVLEEPATTALLQQAAHETKGEMVGLDYKLKSETSLTRKLAVGPTKCGSEGGVEFINMKNLSTVPLDELVCIGRDAKQVDQDVLRYTMTWDTDDYVQGVPLVSAVVCWAE